MVLALGSSAQTKPSALDEARPFAFGEVRSLNSAILGEERVLNIFLPDGYSPDSAATYPVIYVLDGSANEDFPHIAGLAQFMNMYDLLPKSIVMGIANVDRRRDFTHTTRSDSDKVWVPTNGGSALFIDFLAKELQPFVDAHYRTSGARTIIGQSLGGLLATEILFHRPDLFEDYIIVSPSLWWDDGSLAAAADVWVKTNGSTAKRIFFAMARDDDWSKPQVDHVVNVLREHSAAPLQWWYVPFPEETHATILHRAVYRAFEVMNGRK